MKRRRINSQHAHVLRISYGIIFHKIARKYNTIKQRISVISSWPIWLNVWKRAELSVDISIFSISHFLQIFYKQSLSNQVLPIGLIQFILPTTDLLCRRTRHWGGGGAAPPHPPLATPLRDLQTNIETVKNSFMYTRIH